MTPVTHQFLPPFHHVLGMNLMSGGNVGMALLQYGVMYSTAKDIETLTDSQQSTASRMMAGVALGTSVLGGVGEGISVTVKVGQTGRVAVGVADDVVSAAKGGYTVYRSVVNGAYEYVGITKNLTARMSQHARDGRTIEPIFGLSGLTKSQARGVEQALIEGFGLGKNGGTLSNKINSISPNNINYGSMMQEAKQILNNVGWKF